MSWQVVPNILTELLSSRDSEKGRKAMAAVLQMRKLDVAQIQRAIA